MAADFFSIHDRMGIQDLLDSNAPINTSIYYYLCTMNLDFKNHFLEHNSTDTNDTYSDTAALIAGVLTIFQLLGGSF